MKKTLSVALRKRIVAAYDAQEGTRKEVAKRFRVSVGMVKKLLGQRARTGDLRPRHRFSGRKARLVSDHGAKLQQLIAEEPDLTLAELKGRLELGCTVAAIHRVVRRLGMKYRKRPSLRPNKTGRTRRGPDAAGSGAKARPIRRRGWYLSTRWPPKPI